jgi:hypothetical protein
LSFLFRRVAVLCIELHHGGILWGILKHIPQLKVLDVSRQTFPDGDIEISPGTIKELRKRFPGLTKLGLNVSLPGRLETEWSHVFINVLAAFEKPIEIELFLYREHSRSTKLQNNWMNYLKLADVYEKNANDYNYCVRSISRSASDLWGIGTRCSRTGILSNMRW